MRFALDENFDLDIIRGVLRRFPRLDYASVQDVGLRSAPDEEVLAWAAVEGRVLLAHDTSTMSPKANARLAAGLPLPGVLLVRWNAPLRPIIEWLVLLAEAGRPEDWEGQVRYLPL